MSQDAAYPGDLPDNSLLTELIECYTMIPNKAFLRPLRTLFLACLLFALSGLSLAMAGSFEDWFLAVKNNQVNTIRELLAKGFDPNTIEPNKGDTGLILAMRENAMDVMATLLADKRTNIEAEAFNGDNALMIACYNGNEAAVKILLEKGASVEKNGWSPLHYAAANGNNRIVQMLLDKDAFVDIPSPNGTTPLMMAARGGHIYTVKLLHDSGADATMRNQRGYSAIDFALDNQHTDIAKGLEYRIRKAEERDRQKKAASK